MGKVGDQKRSPFSFLLSTVFSDGVRFVAAETLSDQALHVGN